MRQYLISMVIMVTFMLTLKDRPKPTVANVSASNLEYTYIPPKNVSQSYKQVSQSPADVKKIATVRKPKREISYVTVKEEKPKSTFTPLNVNVTKNPGLRVKNLDEKELREYLVKFYNMKNLEGKSLLEMRRIWLAYAYDQFYWDVHEKTGLPVSVIYAYFIMEATSQGMESELMAKYRNPGGIKFTGIGQKVKAYDDCYDRKGRRIKCDFAVFTTYREMVDGWSQIFNAKRYKTCKSENTAPEICECLYRSGYHTGNNWSNRAQLSKGYWELRQAFPKR